MLSLRFDFSNCRFDAFQDTLSLKARHGSLLNQTVEDISDLFRTLLRVAFLATFVVDKGDTEARLISLSPFEVAAQGC